MSTHPFLWVLSLMSYFIPFVTLLCWILIHFIGAFALHIRIGFDNNMLHIEIKRLTLEVYFHIYFKTFKILGCNKLHSLTLVVHLDAYFLSYVVQSLSML